MSFAPSSYDDCLRLSDALESQCLPHSCVPITVYILTGGQWTYIPAACTEFYEFKMPLLTKVFKGCSPSLTHHSKKFNRTKKILTYDSSSPFYHVRVSH